MIHKNSSHGRNCFDVLRHLAALMVIFSHHHALFPRPETTIVAFESNGGLAVAVFFSISGYLVADSFVRSGDFLTFIGKRVRRIFPGLVICAAIVVYGMTSFSLAINQWAYIASYKTFKDFLSMAMMLPVSIPPLVVGYKYAGPANGALWTLPVEFCCYLIFGLAMSMVRSWRTPAVLLVLAIAGQIFLGNATKAISFYAVPVEWLLPYGICFSVGALLSQTKESWREPRVKLALLCAALLMLYTVNEMPERSVMGFAAIALITIMVGTLFPDPFIKGRLDISYGLYIYAWPIDQLVINRTSLNWWQSLLVTTVLTIAAGLASWFLVEKPMTRASRIPLLEWLQVARLRTSMIMRKNRLSRRA
jgi:peptidoglycan/LPS O-acetylase OafA/YrhL